MNELTWVSDPERDDWIFGVREDGDQTNAWYSLKHLSAENDSVNASIQTVIALLNLTDTHN